MVRRVQLEEEELAGLERSEDLAPAGLPEIHLLEVPLGREQFVPVEVRDTDEKLHGATITIDRE